MSSDLQKTQEFIEAFDILSTNLGQDDIYKRILLEVIYIARRDKTGVKLLTQLRGKKILASHLENVDDLRLPSDYKNFIKKSIYENRLLFEPWIESANDYLALRSQLKLRGYSNIPLSNIQEYGSITSAISPEIYTKNINQIKVMVRKSS
jgi:hypothetical protein